MDNIKKLKASMQLAQMRFNADPSEANEQLLDQAVEAWENAQASLSNRMQLVSSETIKPVIPESAAKNGDDALTKNESPKVEQVSGESQNPVVPADTDKSDEKEPAAENPEKKTEAQQPGQAL